MKKLIRGRMNEQMNKRINEWMMYSMCMRKEWIKECSKQIIDWEVGSLCAICVWVKIEWLKECS